MNVRAALVVLLMQAAAFMLPASASGQQTGGPIPCGSRVRATVSEDPSGDGLRYVGILTGWTETDLILDAQDPVSGAVWLGLEGLSQLEVSRGDRRHVFAGLAIGTALGLLPAWILYTELDCPDSQDFDCPMLFPLFMVPGAVLGTIGGALWTSEKWEELPRPY